MTDVRSGRGSCRTGRLRGGRSLRDGYWASRRRARWLREGVSSAFVNWRGDGIADLQGAGRCDNPGMSGQMGLEAGSRRRFLAVCSAMGLGGTLFPGVLLGMVGQAAGTGRGGSGGTAASGAAALRDGAAGTLEHESRVAITEAMIETAAEIAGLTFTPTQRQMMLDGVREKRESVFAIRGMHLENAVSPAVVFDPMPAGTVLKKTAAGPMRMSAAPRVQVSAGEEEKLAFATVRELAEMLRTRKVTSTELTRMYLGRLKKYAPQLHFLITPTDDRAMASAAAADREIAAGRYKGPLHGVPWGAKDLWRCGDIQRRGGRGGLRRSSSTMTRRW